MPIICLVQTDQINPLRDNWNISLSWIGLFNWIPLFFCFMGFQFFLKSQKDRRVAGILLVCGSLPLIISGIAQYWFNIYGPFSFLNGLITWYQRPMLNNSGLTSVFNNQNYAGSWFCMIWPFCLSAFVGSINKKKYKYISLSFLISITNLLILTSSRNAWAGLLILITLMTGLNYIPYILLFILMIFLIINFSPTNLQTLIEGFRINSLFNELNFEISSESFSRLDIWRTSISFIIQRPLIGWGAASFPVLNYSIRENYNYINHSHNLILELILSYGLILTIFIMVPIFLIILKSFQKIFINKTNLNFDYSEKAWFSSFAVLAFSQQLDIQYFDGRISVIFWILLAGLRQIVLEKSTNLKSHHLQTNN